MCISWCPNLSALEPEAVGSGAVVHVVESGAINMARRFVVASGTSVSTVAVSPAVLARCGGTIGRDTAAAPRLIGLTTTTSATVGTIIVVAIVVVAIETRRGGCGGGSAHEMHHFLHLCKKSSFACLKISFAPLERIGFIC